MRVCRAAFTVNTSGTMSTRCVRQGVLFLQLTQQRRAVKPHKDFDGGELLLEDGLVELLREDQRLWEETDAQRSAVISGTTGFCPPQMTDPPPSPQPKKKKKK